MVKNKQTLAKDTPVDTILANLNYLIPGLITPIVVITLLKTWWDHKRTFGEKSVFNGSPEYEDTSKLSAWQSSLQALKGTQLDALPQNERMMHSLWDQQNTSTRAHVAQMLESVGFAGAKVLDRADEKHVELRANHDGAPVRFSVWMAFGSFWSIEMQSAGRIDDLVIKRDHEKLPTEKHDDAWSEDDEQRVFLAEGIFLEGDHQEVSEMRHTFASLSPALQQHVLGEMERLDLKGVRIWSESISLGSNMKLRDLKNPAEYMTECANLMAQIKRGVAA